ncbi:MAG TPA: peptidoglycan-binding domain-containing protein [Blastocatellia bacterium]|nr:peptidoglycan-binding domain-containing protein [Blastocatellia bacterium]
MATVTGRDMLDLARPHIGEEYKNVLVPKNNPDWHGPWDCAEFMSWIVFQKLGILYGCINDNANPALADAYTGSWRVDSDKKGTRVPIGQAAATVGGILLRFPPSVGKMGHIAICDGQGKTVEAMGRAFGVAQGKVAGRHWDTGVLIPGVQYDTNVTPINLPLPPNVYFVGRRDMDINVVKRIQQALRDAGFPPGPIDGIYGPMTAAAAAAFQRTEGIIADGEVGPQTAQKLGISL